MAAKRKKTDLVKLVLAAQAAEAPQEKQENGAIAQSALSAMIQEEIREAAEERAKEKKRKAQWIQSGIEAAHDREAEILSRQSACNHMKEMNKGAEFAAMKIRVRDEKGNWIIQVCYVCQKCSVQFFDPPLVKDGVQQKPLPERYIGYIQPDQIGGAVSV